MSARLAGCGLVMAALVALLAAPSATAHTYLVRSEPADGGTIADAAGKLRLVFSEPVRSELARIELRRLDGARVRLGRPHVSGREATVTLPALRRGTYVVAWTVMSTGDSHVSEGLVVFGVAVAVAPVRRSSSSGPPLVEVVLRWLDLASLALAIGGLVVSLVVLAGVRQARRRALRTVTLAGALAIGVGAGLLIWQAWRLAGGSVLDVPGVTARLLESRWGAEWAAREALVAGLVAVAVLASRRPHLRDECLAAFVVIASLLAVAHSLSSHAGGVQTSRALAVGAEAAHLLAASLWIGGLVTLVVALRGMSVATASAAWRRFGGVAAAGVGVLVVTGLYLAGRQVASLDALIETLYGRALLVKGALFAIACAFGLAGFLVLHRRRPLSRLVLVESTVGLLLLLGAGVLTAAAPALGREFAPTLTAPPASRTGSNGDLLVALFIKPNQPGPNVYDVRVVSTRVPVPAPVTRVRLRLSAAGREVTTPALAHIGGDRYRLGGAQLRRAGGWSITAEIERPGLPVTRVGIGWTVGPASPTRRVVLSDRPLGPLLVRAAGLFAALLLVAAASAAATAAWSARARPPIVIPNHHPRRSPS